MKRPHPHFYFHDHKKNFSLFPFSFRFHKVSFAPGSHEGMNWRSAHNPQI